MNLPLGRFSHRVAMSVCMSVCVSVTSRNTLVRRSWRPLVEECIPNISLWGHNFQQKKFFIVVEQIWFYPPPYARKHKTPTSGCCGDFWSKNVFLISACNNTMIINKNVSVFSRIWFWLTPPPPTRISPKKPLPGVVIWFRFIKFIDQILYSTIP